MRRWSGHRALAGVVGLVMTGALACGDALPQEVLDLRERTLPSRARLLASSNLTRDERTAEATWEIETEMRWEDYRAWVATQLRGFTLADGGPSELRLTKLLDGDTYTLQIEVMSAGPPLHLRIRFQGFPG